MRDEINVDVLSLSGDRGFLLGQWSTRPCALAALAQVTSASTKF